MCIFDRGEFTVLLEPTTFPSFLLAHPVEKVFLDQMVRLFTFLLPPPTELLSFTRNGTRARYFGSRMAAPNSAKPIFFSKVDEIIIFYLPGVLAPPHLPPVGKSCPRSTSPARSLFPIAAWCTPVC